jgi:hypothetical protein
MDYIATSNGKVGHIAASVLPAEGGRKVVTVCGKIYDEYDVRVNNDLSVCSACEGKEEKLVTAAVDEVLPDEVESESDKVESANKDHPKTSKK